MRSVKSLDSYFLELLEGLNEDLGGQILIFSGEVSDLDEYAIDELPNSVRIVTELMRSSFHGDRLEIQFYVEGASAKMGSAGESNVIQRPYREIVESEIVPRFEKSRGPQRFVGKDSHPYLGYADLVSYVAKPYGKLVDTKSHEYLKSGLKNVSRWSWDDANILSNGILSRKSLESPIEFFDELRRLP